MRVPWFLISVVLTLIAFGLAGHFFNEPKAVVAAYYGLIGMLVGSVETLEIIKRSKEKSHVYK